MAGGCVVILEDEMIVPIFPKTFQAFMNYMSMDYIGVMEAYIRDTFDLTPQQRTRRFMESIEQQINEWRGEVRAVPYYKEPAKINEGLDRLHQALELPRLCAHLESLLSQEDIQCVIVRQGNRVLTYK